MTRSFKITCLAATAVAAAGLAWPAGDAVAGELSGRSVKVGALVPLTLKCCAQHLSVYVAVVGMLR